MDMDKRAAAQLGQAIMARSGRVGETEKTLRKLARQYLYPGRQSDTDRRRIAVGVSDIMLPRGADTMAMMWVEMNLYDSLKGQGLCRRIPQEGNKPTPEKLTTHHDPNYQTRRANGSGQTNLTDLEGGILWQKDTDSKRCCIWARSRSISRPPEGLCSPGSSRVCPPSGSAAVGRCTRMISWTSHESWESVHSGKHKRCNCTVKTCRRKRSAGKLRG